MTTATAAAAEALTLQSYPIRNPQRCCNCARPRDVTLLETPYAISKSAVAFSVTWSGSLPLPYCDACAPSATRRAPQRGQNLSIALVAGIVAAGLLVNAGMAEGGGDMMLLVWLVTMGVAYGGLRWWSDSRPRLPGQTSYYQPVRVRALKQTFGGKVIGLKLDFTSSVFEREFQIANEPAYRAGIFESQVLVRS
jgi:hypothetical protein